MRAELQRRGLPVYGRTEVLLHRCRLNGVACDGPPIASHSTTPNPSLSASCNSKVKAGEELAASITSHRER